MNFKAIQILNTNKVKIDELLKRSRKWEDFRSKRLEIIDKYIEQKRKNIVISRFLKIMYQTQIIKKSLKNLVLEKKHRDVKKQNIWLIQKI